MLIVQKKEESALKSALEKLRKKELDETKETRARRATWTF